MASGFDTYGFSQQTTSKLSGFGEFGSFNQSKNDELASIEGLLHLAQQEGGALGEVASELLHPEKSMLSSMGDKFKNAFSSFVDTISIPGQFVAGALSKNVTVREAIEKDINVSDVVWGEIDKDATGLQKVGGFAVRLATDVLTDPLTYLTFGASVGVMGIKSTSKIALGEKAAAKYGKKTGDFIHVSKKGQDKLNKLVSMQASGLRETAKKAGKFKGLEGKELNAFVNSSIHQKLDMDMAKRAMSNLLERSPAYAETLIDKGGIKFASQTLVSSQRIGAAIHLVPGVTQLEKVTQPLRYSVNSLFSTKYTPTGKLPEEFTNITQKWTDLHAKGKVESLDKITDLWRTFKITPEEDDLIRFAVETNVRPTTKNLPGLIDDYNRHINKAGIALPEDELIRNAIEWNTIPSDGRLSSIWNAYKGLTKNNIKQAREAGIPLTETSNYVPHFLVREPVQNIPFKLPPKVSLGRAKEAQVVKFKAVDTGEEVISRTGGEAEKLTRLPDTVTTKNLGEFFEDIDGNTFERVRATVEDAESVGVHFDRSALSTIVKGSLETNRAAVMKGLINDLARDASGNFAVAAGKAPATWRAVSIKGLKEEQIDFSKFFIGKNGEELRFHPAVAKQVEEFMGSVINDEATEKLMRSFDKVQGVWKASVTSVFPAFHGRNAISNVFLHFLDIGLHSLNPTNHIMSADLIKKEMSASKLQKQMFRTGKVGVKAKEEFYDLMNTKIFTDKTGVDWSFGELRRVISDNGVAFNPNIVGAVDIQRPTRELLEDLLPKTTKNGISVQKAKKVLPISQEFLPFKIGRKFGNVVEEQARLLDFMVNLRNTGDVAHAAQRTKMFLFDYQNLTPFEKTFMRRMIPFYTWTRKNIGLQAKTLTESPGRVAAEFTALTSIGDVISGGELTKEEREVLPDWIKDGMTILKKKDGSKVELYGSLGTPTEAVFQSIQPNMILASISPLLRVPIEQMSGYDFFRGKPMSEVTNAATFKSAPKALKDFIGYTEVQGKTKDGREFTWHVSLRPERMNLVLNMPPTSRVFSSLRQMQAEDVQGQSKIIQQLIGVRPYAFDIEEEAARREKETMRQLEDIMNKAGVVGTFNRTYIPNEDKDFSSF